MHAQRKPGHAVESVKLEMTFAFALGGEGLNFEA